MQQIGEMHLRFMPLSRRLLYTMMLIVFGLGYVFAMINVVLSHGGHDGDASMVSGRDLMISYGGDKNATRLGSALRGSMSPNLPDDQKAVIFAWLSRGAPEAEYPGTIEPIMQTYCVACHMPEVNPHLASLTSWEKVKPLTEGDTGMSLGTLVRVSHIHLLGITMMFSLVGMIFMHAYVRPVWIKGLVVSLPFAMLVIDVCAWYLTKLWEHFAWMIIISGGITAVCFATMWLVSFYQLWLYKPAQELTDAGGRLPGDN